MCEDIPNATNLQIDLYGWALILIFTTEWLTSGKDLDFNLVI